MAKDVPNLAKDIYLRTELQTVINPKKFTPRPIIIKFLKAKEKENQKPWRPVGGNRKVFRC